MELCGHKQATAHSHERTKNSNPSKKFSRRQNSNSNLLINSKNPEIVRISFRWNGTRVGNSIQKYAICVKYVGRNHEYFNLELIVAGPLRGELTRTAKKQARKDTHPLAFLLM